MAEAPRKKAKTYHFHEDWEEGFIFTMVKDKCVFMLCHQTQALAKRGKLERHHNTHQQTFKDSFPPKSAIRVRKVEELKSSLTVQQSFFS
ncbi:General transcription factor II-I repeat domain containing protein 2 [Dissostichus eleginoides]|uniref:General transcription factor II-I repeat domain containing protein 2 n=1 Tax=Dissostichus eleginoides TaxID=100907 RepID=A0AAD9BV63_DISEL|nr:General transcription factor II-I repeat domain containing protein 2 [Dissostichus eleginoides]